MKKLFFIFAIILAGITYGQTCNELEEKGYMLGLLRENPNLDFTQLSQEQQSCFRNGVARGIREKTMKIGGVHNGEIINVYTGNSFNTERKCSFSEKLKNLYTKGKYECD